MLAISRFVLFTLILAFVFAAELPSAAQVQGVPASVTSFGFGGKTTPAPGIPASVTSLGPNGFTGMPIIGNFGNCCANFFFPRGFSPFTPSLTPGRRHRRHHDGDPTFGPIAEPVYIPYAVPYAVDPDEDAEDDQDATDRESVISSRSVKRQMAAKGPKGQKTDRDADRDPGYDADRDLATAPEAPPEQVAVQPTTVLVFKDGHHAGVVNYAIVGDTLFDFADGRARKILLSNLDLGATRKANDDQGVEFKIPTGSE